MGAENDSYTWDDPEAPHRATVEDLGGLKEDDTSLAPDKSNDPYAGEMNEVKRHVAGLNRMTSSVRLWIEFSEGDPIVVRAAGMGTGISTDDFDVSLDGGDGRVLIEWDPSLLPPLEAAPSVAMNEAGIGWGELVAGNATAVKVSTKTLADVYTNLKFNVELH